MIDVSVIIPAYNRLWSLPRAVESCRHSRCRTEIIVVDDGSTDGTGAWLQEQHDIRVVMQENQGQTYAVNKGFAVARGEYIRFLDSDDFLTGDIIDRQYEAAVSSGARLVCSRVDFYKEASAEITVCPEIGHWKDFLEVQLSNQYGSHFSGMLFHRSLVEQTPRRPDFALREDRMFLLEIGLLNAKMALVQGCAGYWVQHDRQMQGGYAGLKSQVANWQHLQIFRKILGKLEKEDRLRPEYKKAACSALWPLAFWIAKSDIRAAMEVVEWIYQLDPQFEVPEKGLLKFLFEHIGAANTYKILAVRRFITLQNRHTK